MALGSKASQERRRKAREAARQEQQRGMREVDREVQNILNSLTPTEHDRRMLKLEAFVLGIKLRGEPGTPENVQWADMNLIRIANGQEPIERRVARMPRSMIRGVRQQYRRYDTDEG